MVETRKFDNPNFKGQSYADPGNVLKNAHNPGKKSLDISDIDTLVPEKWDRVEVTFNSDNNPTESIYYRDEFAEITEVICVDDNAGSLNNKYFILYSGRDQTKYHVWFNVNSGGTDPSPAGSTPIEVALNTNDPKEVVALATKQQIDNLDDFTATVNLEVITITNEEKGLTTNSSDFNSGFSFRALQEGGEESVRTVTLTYSSDKYPIYRNQELYGYNYDVFSGKFILNNLAKYETTDGSGDPAINIVGDITLSQLSTPTIQNITAASASTEYNVVIPSNTKKYMIRNRNTGKIQYSFITGQTNTNFITIMPGNTIEETGLDLTSSLTIYFETSKPNQIIEVLSWQ
jgi:hypothetical protein